MAAVVYEFRPRESDVVIKQEELAELRRLLFMKVLADSLFMKHNLEIMEKLGQGATIESGALSYSQTDGLLEA